MASSFTGLGTELMTTGENAGTWGTTTNTNLQIIEQISGGYTEQDIGGSADTTTLSVSDGSSGAVLAHRIIEFTGTITGNQIVTIPLVIIPIISPTRSLQILQHHKNLYQQVL